MWVRYECPNNTERTRTTWGAVWKLRVMALMWREAFHTVVPETENARLLTVERHARHSQVMGGRWLQSLSRRHVCNTGEAGLEVSGCCAMAGSVCQHRKCAQGHTASEGWWARSLHRIAKQHDTVRQIWPHMDKELMAGPEVGRQCWRRTVVHHMNSILSLLSCRRLQLKKTDCKWNT